MQDGGGISHLPSVPDGQRVVGNLQVKLLKVDLDHLRSRTSTQSTAGDALRLCSEVNQTEAELEREKKTKHFN